MLLFTLTVGDVCDIRCGPMLQQRLAQAFPV